MNNRKQVADKLINQHTLSAKEWACLLNSPTPELTDYLKKSARDTTDRIFGRQVYVRGLIEFTNICKKDCYYCGIRKSNSCVERYRLTEEEILSCCKEGYEAGLRTFVLQGGEDGYFTEGRICSLVKEIHKKYPDCAITLSVGEWEKESYERFYEAGAERFLLRQETANAEHYGRLHPENQRHSTRIECLENLKKIGYQTGCGFLVGSPYQTMDCIIEDLLFLERFRPQMVGIGPFLPAKNTPFASEPAGSSEMTLFLLSAIRLMLPEVLLPATTALGTARNDGRMQGLLHGANVIMPNLSPVRVREKYTLYDNKIHRGNEAAEHLDALRNELAKENFTVAISRGDAPGFAK
ncbi:MAG: [Lachnospiraceae bacterium]|nr:[FeFe] hydrogenase H-cluster radical SAM maturase HydE [Lachnospiraceae bacterium]